MPHRRILPRAALSLLLALAVWIVPSSLHAEPEPAELRVSAPVGATVGDRIDFGVTLLDAGGEPIGGAPVALYEQAGFMGVSGREVAVAVASTSEDGTAVLRYAVRREGARAFTVRYEGDADHAPASAAIDLPVAAGAATYTVEPPTGIPGVNRFLVIAVLVVVWGTMLIVALHVIAIAREGSAVGTPGREADA